ncbi:hypothetical protein OFM21_30465, partial [Escherichia coli]|nr:hypothetical protein [Escherichia coli]
IYSLFAGAPISKLSLTQFKAQHESWRLDILSHKTLFLRKQLVFLLPAVLAKWADYLLEPEKTLEHLHARQKFVETLCLATFLEEPGY